jgi:hypothetical protein
MHGNKKWTAAVVALVLVAGIVAIVGGAFSTGKPTARPVAPRPSSPRSHTTSTVWAANAAAGVTWSVSDVTVSSAPIWTQALATGWQPPDPRMDDLDVTGNLTVTQIGQPPIIRPFSLQLGLGTAEYHDGCGAMSLNNWRLG